MTGTVYLLHLEPGLPVSAGRVARHYLGFTEGRVEDRLAHHLSGRGSPLVKAVLAAGGTVIVERTWTGVDRAFERALKRRHEAPRLCPRCVHAGHTGGRGPLLLHLDAPGLRGRPRPAPVAQPVTPAPRIGR